MKIYTKKGDRGTTSLWRGGAISKSDPLIEAIGCVDEVNAHLGACVSLLPPSAEGELRSSLLRCQGDLFEIGAELADGKGEPRISAAHVARLEAEIDSMTAKLPPLDRFILPGGSLAAAQLHVARTVARRAERALVGLREERAVPEVLLAYLNRLSDYLFTAARLVNASSGIKEAQWPGNGD